MPACLSTRDRTELSWEVLSPFAQIEIFVSLSSRLCPCGLSADQPQARVEARWTQSVLPLLGNTPLPVLGDTCAGCPNHPHHGPTVPAKTLQQERHLPTAKDAREGERQDCHWEAARQGAGARQHCCVPQCSPGRWKKMRVGREETLKYFMVQECFFKRCF